MKTLDVRQCSIAVAVGLGSSWPLTLLVYAMGAKVITRETAAEVARLLPNGQVGGVQAGHMIPWDNLEDFLDVTKRFFSVR